MKALAITGGDRQNCGRIPGRVLWICAVLAGFGMTAMGARYWLESGFAWRCPSLTLFGVPCPSCGSTRALAALVEFDLLRALTFNPLVVFALAFLLFGPLFRFRNATLSNLGWIIFAAAVGLNWIYLVLFLPR